MGMKKFFACTAALLVTLTIGSNSLAVEPAAQPTHLLQPMILEVAATKPDGNPWDTGVGAYARPDLQVTLMRDDAAGLKQATELLVQAMELKMKQLGRPASPMFREMLARQAHQSLRCGVTIEAFNDQALKDARSKFAADTKVANDSLLTKLVDGGLAVTLGDKIMIYVNDSDLAQHDPMGQAELVINKELIAKGEIELKFNSIESLRLRLTPIAK